jgi:hypothetical protein
LGRTGAAERLVHSSKYLAGSNNGGAIAEPAARLQRQSVITGDAAMTMQSDISVETADAEDVWWDDADAEENPPAQGRREGVQQVARAAATASRVRDGRA